MKYRKYRAYASWPGVFFFAEKNGAKMRVIVKNASFENGTFTIHRVLPEGKREMDFETWRDSASPRIP